jgi:hypothetical protein
MLVASGLAILATAGVAAGASGATRYAAPSGTGPEPCAVATPCNIDLAVEGPGVTAGDVIKVLPGTHVPAVGPGGTSWALRVQNPVTIEAADPANPPTISATGMTTVIVSSPGAVLRDVRVTGSGAEAINVQTSALVERVHASTTTVHAAIATRDGTTVRDSVAWTPHVSGSALRTGGTGATLENVTAVGGFRGISIDSNYTAAGATQAVTIVNTIAAGGTPGDDLFIRETTVPSHPEVVVALDHSNYDDLVNSGAEVTEVQTQTDPPDLLLPSLGNFHQLDASPTVNAGVVRPTTATRLDPDGEARWLGAAPDIGADEFTEAPPPTPPSPPGADTASPDTTITKAPRKQVRTAKRKVKAKLKFTATEPGVTFECKLDRKPFTPCASPFKAKVKKGRHAFQVRATDGAGNVDPTPAKARWKVKPRR